MDKAPLPAFLAANPFPRPLTDGLFYREKMRAIHRVAPDTLGVGARAPRVLEIGGGRSGLAALLYPGAEITTLDRDFPHLGHGPGREHSVYVCGDACRLPFADGAFDAALAILTTHHWTDPLRGLAEMHRVSRRQVVLTWAQDYTAQHFWFLTDYLPEAAEREADLAAAATITAAWPESRVHPVPVPHDCTDGFFAAYWRRPEAYLVPAVRASISGLALLDPELVESAVRRLARDLESGAWAERYADLLGLEALDCGYRLVVAELG
jgi:SAM-dependent methyltransferase